MMFPAFKSLIFASFFLFSIPEAQGSGGRGAGDHAPNFVKIAGFFEYFTVSSENFRTFAVGKDRGFEFFI